MSDIYRDRTEGATAKRQDLLRRRRDELATMPHAVRRVVVARHARIVASLAVIVSGGALVALAMWPTQVERIAGLFPGQPAVLSALLGITWVVGLFAWWVARARREQQFAVAMSRLVLPGEDLDHDLQRLDHERPGEAARGMAQRQEPASAALPVLASAVLLPATAVYLAAIVTAHGWPLLSDLEAALAANAQALATIAGIGVIAALAAVFGVARVAIVARVATPIALISAVTAGKLESWPLLCAAVIAGPLALVAWRLRVERAAIEADAPGPATPAFTLRGAIRRAREVMGATGGFACRNRRATAIVTLAVVATGAGYLRASHRGRAASRELPTPSLSRLDGQVGTEARGVDPGYHVDRMADGRLRVDVVLGNGAIELPALADLDSVPSGWRASVSVEMSSSTSGSVFVTPFVDQAPLRLYAGVPQTFVIDTCDGPPVALGLSVKRVAGAVSDAEHYTLFVAPTLELARCE